MIEFACMYCGQPVRVGKELIGKRIDCPACGHSVPVRPRKARQPVQSARSAGAAAGQGESWADRSDEEIIGELLVQAMPPAERCRLEIKRILAPLLPRYDDLTLFSLSLAFVLVCLTSAEWRESVPHLLRTATEASAIHAIASLAIAGLGMVLSLANVFFRREKYESEKALMLFFAIMATAGTGIMAGQRVLERSHGLLAVFPVWNIVNGMVLVILAWSGSLDTDCLTGYRAGAWNVLIATVSIALLVLPCRYVLNLDPLITFSVATCYTISLSGVVQDLFTRCTPPTAINTRTS